MIKIQIERMVVDMICKETDRSNKLDDENKGSVVSQCNYAYSQGKLQALVDVLTMLQSDRYKKGFHKQNES